MNAFLALGLRVAIERWALVVTLFVASSTSAFAFAGIVWGWLSLSLDGSLATRTLLARFDANVFVDLLVHHRGSLEMLLIAAALLLAVYVLVWVWLNGVAAVAVGEGAPFAECAWRSLGLCPRLLRLWLVSTTFQVGAAVSVFFLARLFVRWTYESPNEMTYYRIIGGAAGLGGAFAIALGAVHDHARAYCVATRAGSLQAYRWALWFVAGGDRRALPLSFVLAALGALVWLVYQTTGMLIRADWSLGLAASLLWGQIFLFLRLFLRVWTYAVVSRLQESADLAS